MRRHAAPIIAAIVLLLPLMYVVSYVANVLPQAQMTTTVFRPPGGVIQQRWTISHYRVGHRIAPRVYWPLEQIDRKLRPLKWERPFIHRSVRFRASFPSDTTAPVLVEKGITEPDK